MDRREWKSRPVGEPQPGYFLMKLSRGGPQVPAQIRKIDGLWSAVINGEAFPPASDPAAAPRVFTIWHSAEEITEAEYRRRLAESKQAPPDHPLANPREAISTKTRVSLF